MKNVFRTGLLLGAAMVVGAGVALAQMGEPRQPQLPGEPPETNRGRFADRFLGEFDLNHDGKVTRDEFNKAVAKDFYDATHGGQTMSEDQFIAARTKDLHQRVTEMFHRSDWNGDGKLSFDEFAAPTRAVFERMDRDGTGIAACSARRSFADDAPPARGKAGPAGASYNNRSRSSNSSGGSRGRGSFCAEFDLNRDGKVTRAELDQGLHQQFQAATKGGQFMSLDQLYGLELAHYREMDARIFQHMNTSYTGKLTLQEYSASEAKFFARLDKNGDGVITADELSRSRGSSNARVAKSGR
jgi:Ca2+-binding EF-hand superfamily protein